MKIPMILIDTHVHIYKCFDLCRFFDAAYENFRSRATILGNADNFTGILLLAETSSDNWFRHLSDYADGKSLPGKTTAGTWKFHRLDEPESLCATSNDNYEIVVVAGRQIVTAEGLELLALQTAASFNDGLPIRELIKNVIKEGGLPVIPWGFGKWFGRRGKILRNLIQTSEYADFLLGDNSGRPNFWPLPEFFKLGHKRGMRVLPGSDPLPLANEYQRVGRFGLMTHEVLSPAKPSKDLRQILLRPNADLLPYGDLEKPLRFLYNQIRLRI
jgi:hypothetical protein